MSFGPNFDLYTYRIPGHEAFYIPNFVTQAEEEYLIRKLREAPQHKWRQLANRRLQLWGGELTNSHVLLAQPFPPIFNKYPDLLTRIKTIGAFETAPHKEPNHIIVNEYLPGQGIMPHEDGPAYHPVVATISLGSHSVFHYYKYRDEERDALAQPIGGETPEGRAIDPTPILTLLLEPRSLVITKGALYRSHLHGIREITEDRVLRKDHGPTIADLDVKIDNWNMLIDEGIRQVVRMGGVLPRQTRYSLTCRDVGRVRNIKSATIGRRQ